MKKKILVTGGDGRFSKILKQKNKSLKLFFASKRQCNILNIKSIEKILLDKPLRHFMTDNKNKIYEDIDGNIYVSSDFNGVYRINFNNFRR